MKYCPICRSDLASRTLDGRNRLACTSSTCKFVNWNNPVPVVAGLIRYRGNYILARNSAWPQGMFSVITGFLEQGESPDTAIIRETEEELGLQGGECTFIGHFSLPEFNQLIIAYAVESHGEIKLDEEIEEIRIVTPEQLASFDFGHLELSSSIIKRWLQLA